MVTFEEDTRDRRVGDLGMGGLVQPPLAARTDRLAIYGQPKLRQTITDNYPVRSFRPDSH